jgi:hypothetical protein
MRANKLRVGDRIRIVRLPGVGIAGYHLHPETKRAYRKLVSRGRSLRVCKIDQDGLAWYNFRIKRNNGSWQYHSMCVTPEDDNWVTVKRRRKKTHD